MAKYMVLYRSSVSAQEQMASASPEQAQEGMAMWMRWAEKAGPAIVDLGSPLGASHAVPSGADLQGGMTIGGFSVLQTDSADDVDNCWTTTRTCRCRAPSSRCSAVPGDPGHVTLVSEAGSRRSPASRPSAAGASPGAAGDGRDRVFARCAARRPRVIVLHTESRRSHGHRCGQGHDAVLRMVRRRPGTAVHPRHVRPRRRLERPGAAPGRPVHLHHLRPAWPHPQRAADAAGVGAVACRGRRRADRGAAPGQPGRGRARPAAPASPWSWPGTVTSCSAAGCSPSRPSSPWNP